jgi:electron transfer flavoprotein alpha subunit
MSKVLIIAEPVNGQINKASFELATYGHKTAQMLNGECAALILGEASNAEEIAQYGAARIIQIKDPGLTHFDSQVYASTIATVAKEIGADIVVLRFSANGKALEGRLAVKLGAGSVSAVNALPEINASDFIVRKSVYSGKAIASYKITTPIKVLSLIGNCIQPEVIGSSASVESINVEIPEAKVKVTNRETISGIVPLPEAELVVSAGRGMKGPENWGIIEELAEVIGATTACSRPVADTGWRPHHEHVGQTGVAIRPNLYFAIGISGAIQHLAGVNNSKVIVVINKDPEAPFFKAADYGIQADLFDVVPKLTDAFKRFRAQS